ncbi:MAG: Ig-like domain-containing protein [Paracoccaceae bacterium]
MGSPIAVGLRRHADGERDGTYDSIRTGVRASGGTAEETFSYTISDGNGGTSTASVTITITGVNDAPVAGDDTDTTDEDTGLEGALLGNDTDVEGDALSVSGTASRRTTREARSSWPPAPR